LHGKVCSFGVCAACPDSTGEVGWWLAFRRKHRLGDKVERVTRAIGVKPCGGCRKRKAYLNGDAIHGASGLKTASGSVR